jgi:hypothetical protein
MCFNARTHTTANFVSKSKVKNIHTPLVAHTHTHHSELRLENNALQTLPSDVFNGLSALRFA